MNKRQYILLSVGIVLFAVMWLYCPWEKVEYTFHVFPVRHGPIVSMGHNREVKEVRTCAAGYAWRFSGPVQEPAWFGSENVYRVDQRRLGLQWAVLAVALFIGTVSLRSKEPAEVRDARSASIGPASPT